MPSIEIALQPAYFKFSYLYVPAARTGFFPPGQPKTEQPIKVVSAAGTFAARLQYNSKAHV